jgi:hypothetical protein
MRKGWETDRHNIEFYPCRTRPPEDLRESRNLLTRKSHIWKAKKEEREREERGPPMGKPSGKRKIFPLK